MKDEQKHSAVSRRGEQKQDLSVAEQYQELIRLRREVQSAFKTLSTKNQREPKKNH
jgi:hypothetical protein